MVDPLTEKIEQERAERDNAAAQRDLWQHRLEIISARLEALEQAAQLRPLPHSQTVRGGFGESAARAAQGGPARKGRQLGAISKNWRTILLGMALRYPAGATGQDIVAMAQQEGIADLKNLRPRDAARQMQKYRDLDYVELVNPLIGSWRITEAAYQRFNIPPAAESKAATDSPSVAASELSSAERV
jgi:hypothetical protein